VSAVSADILVVEDEPAIRAVIERILRRSGYRPVSAADVSSAREVLVDGTFDLLLCDIHLGRESGLDLVREVARDRPDTAIVMATGADDRATAGAAIDLGAHGYLVKPFTANELLIQVDMALRHRALERARRLHVEELELKLLERSRSLREALNRAGSARSTSTNGSREVADRLSAALALRDEETGYHVARVGRFAALVAGRAGLDHRPLVDLEVAAMLHDVGKIAVPDTVLLKPGQLTEEDWLLIRRHPEAGYRLLEGTATDVLQLAATMALSHHERWDGNGYPRRLSGTAIPLEGRVVAVADVFDALTSDRVYRPALSVDEAVAIMIAGRAVHFDPDLLDVFLADVDEVVRIRADLVDPPPPEDSIDVLVVDPRRMYGETLVRLLDRAVGIGMTGWVGSLGGALDVLRRRRVDVIVTDWELPDGSGGELARRVLAERPELRVVVAADTCEEPLLLEALEAGCFGCVTKANALDDLTAAIRRAHAGDPLVPPGRLSSLLRRLGPLELPSSAHPTARERDILELMVDGLSVEAIAERLTLDDGDVQAAIDRLMAKFAVYSRLAAIVVGVRAGFAGRP
jgi:putative two-component system response regulator